MGVEEETRIIIAPSSSSASDPAGGRFLQLRHPKTGDATCYLLINDGLQEVNWFKQSYSSWFIGDYISQDGSLYAATQVDPVFILLPIFDKHARSFILFCTIKYYYVNCSCQRAYLSTIYGLISGIVWLIQNGDDQGMFRQLDDIIYLHDYPGYHHLAKIAENSMEVVCDCKEIGSTKFYRLNDSKVLAWMYCKVQQLKQNLLNLDKNYAAQNQKDTLADAVMILGEYLADEPWLKLLCNNLRLSMDEAVQAPDTDIQASAAPSIHSSFNPVQEQTTGDKRVTRNGKQNKKAKVTNSHSIKDMFNKASRRGR
ncbi:ribonuclease H2 subunit B [Tanacetum coccineum]